MDVRRLLTAVGAGLLGVAVTAVGTPTAASAAPAAPKSFSVARAPGDVHKITVTWKAVADADHYVVDSIAGDVETIINVPASTTSYTIDAPDNCTNYKIRVGAADAAGATSSTTFWSLKSLTPGTVMGMSTGRDADGTVATASWRAPSWTGYTPLTGYRAIFTRLSDGVVLSDTTSLDTSFRYPGVDPARAYTLAVTTVNEYGACSTAKSLLDRFRPADPTNLVVQRRADAPGTVEVVWKSATSGPVPTYYLISYGQTKVTSSVRIDAPTTSATLPLDVAKNWIVEVKAYNDNGGSGAVAGSVPVFEATAAAPAPATEPTATPAPTATATPEPGVTTAPVEAGTPTVQPTDSTTTTTTVTTGSDRTPPTITTSLSQAPYNGWFKTPVTIHFTCKDDSGTIASCPSDIRAGTDGTGQRFSGTAVDAAGNTATIVLTLNVDQTAPAITATVRGTKNAAGWYTTAPVVTYACSDVVSGVSTLLSCPADTPVTVDGVNQTVIGTATDKAGNTATATVVLNIDQVAPAISASVVGDANADGWFTTAPTVRFTCSDAVSGIATCPADRKITTDGVGQKITGTAVDKAGNSTSTSVTLNVDQTAPAITATVLGDVSADGWYSASPTVRFTCSDAGAGVKTCPADVKVDGEGANLPVTGTATDKAGNTATTSVTVNVDRTAPSITATLVGEANGDGWFRTAPTVHFTCVEAGSGLAACPEDTQVTTDGAGQTVIGTAVDKAGNTATASVVVSVDRTTPAVTAAVLGEANADGWYRTAPTVHFTCTDATSGIAGCPADATVADGTGKIVMGTAADRAGNTATTSVTVSVDQTAPAITATLVDEPNADGWFNSAPTVHFTCTDEGSGIAECPADATVTTEGAGQVVSGTATDKAGNTATATVTVNVDLVSPELTATVDGTKNAAGWYRSAPTVRYTCTDTGSGLGSCPADATVTTDGADISVPGSAADKAGNTSTSTTTLSVDLTAPVVTASLVGAANANGWFTTAPTVHFTCTDTGSGIADCPADATVTTTGGGQVVSGTATDKAGNTATATVTVDVDLVSPELTATVDGTKNAAGWYRGAPTVRYTCTDTGSGVASCPADATVAGEGAGISVPGAAGDKAGNTTSRTTTVNVDKTAPVVTVVGATNGAKYGADAAPAVSCRTTDALSGVVTEAKATDTTDNGVHTVVCAGATDKAGNAAAQVGITYTVEATGNWLSALTHKYLDGKANAAALKDLDAAIAKRNWGQFIAKVVVQSLGRNPALNPTQSATLIWYAMTVNCRD
ncbi:Neogenin [Nucisporomicrobium flavum]|uniref:Neogenin n=1 Tax=Nucisporomicrobium flavum TaxID=2785915 RepID=UPI003C30A664